MVAGEELRPMVQMAGFRETLRRLAMIDEGFVEDQAGVGLCLTRTAALDPKTAALLQRGAAVAIGSPAVCLEWSATRALATGASEDEIADVLLAIAPVCGLGRVVCAAPDVATALGYDVRPRWRNWMITDAPPPVTSTCRRTGGGASRRLRTNGPGGRPVTRRDVASGALTARQAS
jgi:alkylhydroperoxidase/carboxymuconolactone decarboxylase family protein YurZ